MRLEVTIPDQLYSGAQRAVAASGFDSIDSYLTDLISHDVQPGTDNHDCVFTGEVAADLHVAAAAARTGKNVSIDEFRAEAKLKNEAWQANHPG